MTKDLASLALYIEKLKAHDWVFDYTDDHRVWTKGAADRKVLETFRMSIDVDFEVWNEYAPAAFRRGT